MAVSVMLRDYHVEIFSTLDIVFYIATRRSKITRWATGRYAATSFDQLLVCPRSWFVIVGVAFFFLSPKAIPRFRPFSLVGPTQAFAFSKKSYEEGIYT